MSLVSAQARQASLFETGADLTLRLTNDGMQPLTLIGSAHRLFVNGSFVGRAVSNEHVILSGYGTATQTVTVYLENLTLVRKALEFGNAPSLAYRLDSQFQPADGGHLGGIKTSITGELDLSAFGAGVPLAAP